MSPMRVLDTHPCEAGTKGGNSERGRELRRAQLDMDRHTNPLLNRRQSVQAHPLFTSLPKKGTDGEPCGLNSPPGSTLESIPANNGILPPATNGNQERGNPIEALKASALSRQSAACPDGEGLPQKQMPPGKPGDMLTEARQSGQ